MTTLDKSLEMGPNEKENYDLKSAEGLPDEDIELAVALEQYVPGSAAEKRLLRKIDLVLLPILWLMYVLAWIDRGNISNASAAGLNTQLHLSDSDYSMVVSIFFIGYVLCEVPSNLVLSKMRPSLYLSGIMLVWKRFAIFYTSGCISPALGGIMAGAVIDKLEGVRGWPGWRWLFMSEGVISVFFAFLFALLLVDYPSTTKKFFTSEELQLAYIRILHNRESRVEQQQDRLTPWQTVCAVAADARVYAFAVLYVFDQTSASITYFIPTVLEDMGYNSVSTRWMTVPIWMCGAVIMVIASISSDYFQDRRGHIVGCMLTCFISCIVCLTVSNNKVRYAMLCLYIGGFIIAVSQILNWTSITFAFPDQKRSVAIAFVNSCGNLFSLWGSRLWPSSQGPRYIMGFATIAGMTGSATILAFAMPYLFKLLPKEPRTKAERDLLARQEAREATADDQIS